MPPIGTDRESRLILFDLAPILPALRREGTTFIPHSARIERSKNYGFWDEPYIEAIHVTSKSCPPASEVPNFLTPDKSRAQVSYEIDPALTDCPKCALCHRTPCKYAHTHTFPCPVWQAHPHRGHHARQRRRRDGLGPDV